MSSRYDHECTLNIPRELRAAIDAWQHSLPIGECQPENTSIAIYSAFSDGSATASLVVAADSPLISPTDLFSSDFEINIDDEDGSPIVRDVTFRDLLGQSPYVYEENGETYALFIEATDELPDADDYELVEDGDGSELADAIERFSR